jgi:hypothetical protein
MAKSYRFACVPRVAQKPLTWCEDVRGTNDQEHRGGTKGM